MNRSELKDGMRVTVNWPQGAELATVFWNEKFRTFGLRFEVDGFDEFPEIDEAVLEILEP